MLRLKLIHLSKMGPCRLMNLDIHNNKCQANRGFHRIPFCAMFLKGIFNNRAIICCIIFDCDADVDVTFSYFENEWNQYSKKAKSGSTKWLKRHYDTIKCPYDRNILLYVKETCTYSSLCFFCPHCIIVCLRIGYTPAHQMTRYKADSRFVPSQWETALHCNAVL